MSLTIELLFITKIIPPDISTVVTSKVGKHPILSHPSWWLLRWESVPRLTVRENKNALFVKVKIIFYLLLLSLPFLLCHPHPNLLCHPRESQSPHAATKISSICIDMDMAAKIRVWNFSGEVDPIDMELASMTRLSSTTSPLTNRHSASMMDLTTLLTSRSELRRGCDGEERGLCDVGNSHLEALAGVCGLRQGQASRNVDGNGE